MDLQRIPPFGGLARTSSLALDSWQSPQDEAEKERAERMATLKEEIVLNLTMRGGEALVELREQAGITREFLAVQIGRASSTVELWERMGRPIKNTDILRIADVIEERLGEDHRARTKWAAALIMS